MNIQTHQGPLHSSDIIPTLNAALNNNFSIALFQLPGNNEPGLIYGPAVEMPIKEVEQKGFVVASFDNHQRATIIQPSDVFPLAHDETAEEPDWHCQEMQGNGLDYETFRKMARYGVEQVKAGSFDKVVVANQQTRELPENWSPLNCFFELCKQYPDAFVSLVSIPEYGTWLGASPELLLYFKRKEIQTTAVAGTRTDNDTDFGDKDKQEQQLVAQYIEGCFEDLALDYDKEGPESVKAGSIHHLQTKYKASLNGDQDKNWQEILSTLHPTPAVCGHPQKVTKIFIRNEEPFDRKLFSGFLGPVYWNHEENHLYVNLRCMEWHGDKASFFAGAGLVKGSKPEEEWEETQEKMNTLLKVVQASS